MKDLVDTTEMYLRTIYELEEEGIPPLRARIAERLEQSGPTVSQTVARMERDGLLHIAPDRSLKLTPEGRERATAIMRKHRLAERLLTDVLGLPWESVHDEACRWEHVMGEEVERRLVAVLDEYTTSPFGNPIPGLDVLLGEDVSQDLSGTVRASDVNLSSPTAATIVSINEIVQVEHKIMAKFGTYGIGPDADVTLVTNDDGLVITSAKGELTVPPELGHAIRIRIREA
ncbi:metal-dependent transcriptional regulator [Corynebacterium bovis]|uniref:Diphtheria toxin repressor n=1 Tax=Corynebacterium bovis DSM 20582 = CIP 54.80 TaxID=927655 RepID=A0A8H9Y8F8_9CORY|nr:metal-dependent transcriptional regulator [Corynebacterium bovis]MBB3116538.1 DtxR family Mn-dependent transcriptional regulator [Corynebacterium bovis DSM 20582 = CIP 54.80]QQC47701.1 metal-dependent transcriptional regulator [Corynebacterium bovis]WJY77511.1 Diphtheria toxin repressor [Corynebacterium bovis DSM 20582 = CIP 54.80]